MSGADKAAKVAANTFFPIQDWLALFVQVDGLMTAVCTGDNAAATPQTSVVIKLGEKNGIPFQDIGSSADGVERKSRDVFYGRKAFVMEIVIKAGLQIFNYAIAVLHDSSRDLQGTGA